MVSIVDCSSPRFAEFLSSLGVLKQFGQLVSKVGRIEWSVEKAAACVGYHFRKAAMIGYYYRHRIG